MFGLMVFLLLLYIFVRFGKNTPAEISIKTGNLAGVLYFIDVFVFIIPGILGYYYGISSGYTTFYSTRESEISASYWAIYLIATFFIVLFLFFRLGRIRSLKKDESRFEDSKRINLFLSATLLLSIFIVIAFNFYGIKHAVLASTSGASLIEIRLANRYSGVPTVLMSWFVVCGKLASILSGVIFRKSSALKKIYLLLMIIFLGTYLGNKSTVAYYLLGFFLASLMSNTKINAARLYVYALFAVLFIGVAFSIMLFLQFSEDHGFDLFSYFMIRAVLGQVGGFYEQMALGLRNPEYIWNSIPFANYVIAYPIFNKDLMMHTWGQGLSDPTQTGVMNSLFGGEAFAIGGYLGLILSPFFAAANYFAAYVVILWILRKFAGLCDSQARFIVILLVPSLFTLTGDFAGIFLFKYLFICVIPILAISMLLRLRLAILHK
jgi:hypothetical protein